VGEEEDVGIALANFATRVTTRRLTFAYHLELSEILPIGLLYRLLFHHQAIFLA